MNTKAVFTISSKNYFAQGTTLLDSLFALYQNDIDYYYLIVDEDLTGLGDYNKSYNLVLAKDINIPNYYDLVFKYDVVEFNTAVKPFFMDWLIEKYQSVVYFDPDIFVYKSIDFIFDKLTNHNIVLTPHVINPDYRITEIEPNEIIFLKVGVFNLGFIAIARSEETKKFIDWFKSRTEQLCFNRVEAGLYVDQKWMDFVPCLFRSYYIITEKGYNVACWNLLERNYTLEETKDIVFYHFSSFDPQNDQIISKSNPQLYTLKNFPVFTEMFKQYGKILTENGHPHYRKIKYSYNHFNNDLKITQFHRNAFNRGEVKGDPFETKKFSYFYVKGNLLSRMKAYLKKNPLARKVKKRYVDPS